MSESTNENIEELLQDADGDSDLVKKLRGVIRNQQKAVKEATEAAQKVQREQVFRTVGLNPNEGLSKLFYETYNGELSEEAVREAAQGYGLVKPEEQQEQQEQATAEQLERQREQEAFNAMNSALGGAAPNDGSIDDGQQAQQVFKDVYSKTGNAEEAMAQVFADKLTRKVGVKQ